MNFTLLETSLNLRVENGKKNYDYVLSEEVAKKQIETNADIIANVEDMEGCRRNGYDETMQNADYQCVSSLNDFQYRGVSCWIKNNHQVKKIKSLTDPHFMHVQIDDKINLLILRILVSSSGNSTQEQVMKDFKNRREQWEQILKYIDGLKNEHIILTGDFNHGVISQTYSSDKARYYYNYQQIVSDLELRNMRIVPIEGDSYAGYMKIDHIAVTKEINIKKAGYVNAFPNNYAKKTGTKIGIPDHKFIISELELSEVS